MPLNYLEFFKILYTVSKNYSFKTFVEKILLLIKKIEIYIYA